MSSVDPYLEPPNKRPVAVTILVILFVMQMPILFTNLAFALWEIGILGSSNPVQQLQIVMSTWGGELGALKAFWLWSLLLVIALVTFALFKLRPWAWTAAMLVLGGRLALGVWDFFDQKPYFFIMILYILPVILLNLEDVRIAFGERLPISPKDVIDDEKNRLF